MALYGYIAGVMLVAVFIAWWTQQRVRYIDADFLATRGLFSVIIIIFSWVAATVAIHLNHSVVGGLKDEVAVGLFAAIATVVVLNLTVYQVIVSVLRYRRTLMLRHLRDLPLEEVAQVARDLGFLQLGCRWVDLHGNWKNFASRDELARFIGSLLTYVNDDGAFKTAGQHIWEAFGLKPGKDFAEIVGSRYVDRDFSEKLIRGIEKAQEDDRQRRLKNRRTKIIERGKVAAGFRQPEKG
ncbi:MAG TPA: hypothetical protein VEB60_03180 [Candidatus Paceibacterota bacterium]|nr:hypothetical protein [Candidatus Paceibacterota bacterium]